LDLRFQKVRFQKVIFKNAVKRFGKIAVWSLKS